MSETIFEKILDKQIPCKKVYEDDDVLAFHDINPQAPVHVLVIPKQKIKSFNEISNFSPETTARYMHAIAKVAKELGLEDNGYRIVFNTGTNGQQTVDYIHAHILGGRQMQWPPG